MPVQALTQQGVSAQEIAARITELVTLPAVYLEVRRVVNDPASAVLDLASVVASDPAISARVLRVANSAAYRTLHGVGTLSQAVGVLGMQRVHDLALASSLASAFDKLPMTDASMAAYWSRAVSTALVARSVAVTLELDDVEGPFLQGLLAEIGHLAMFQAAPECVRPVIERAPITDPAVPAVEREVLGFSHADVGAALLRLWSLPERLCAVVESHAEPPLEDGCLEPTVCHLAWHVACALASEQTIAERLQALPAPVREHVGLSLERLVEAAESGIGEADELLALFFPQLARSA